MVMRKPVLQLNASYEAIRIVTARRALKLITKGIAVVEVPTNVEVYPGIYLPSVIRLRHYRRIPIRMQVMTRKNIYLRDNHCCLYCGQRFSAEALTLDHVTPRSKGGRNTWENLVTACSPCNRKKDNRTPEEAGMPLLRRPLPATVHTSRFLLRLVGSQVEEWKQYLFHDGASDERYVGRDVSLV